MMINLLLVFWFHLTGDILYHRNLKIKRGFFTFLSSYLFFREGKESLYGKRYGFDFKLRCVKLRLEEGLPVSLLSKEAGCSQDVIRRWTRTYQKRGEAGLRNAMVSGGSRQKLAEPVREKIVEIKKREPLSGVKRISHFLKRAFFLSASPETMRRALRAESLMVSSKKKHPSNITRPRFFERTTPDQMWQSDIFTFRLGGRYAYLIGFIDDPYIAWCTIPSSSISRDPAGECTNPKN
jgi:transposase-like protein